MKKLFALTLALAMVLTLFAGCASGNTDETTEATENETITTEEVTEPSTEAASNLPASALEVLENVWAAYAEDEKFAVMGGNMESVVDGAPGNYDMAYAENLTYNLLVPADALASVDQAATMIHMMNANTFTSGVVHLTEGTDAAAFAATMQQAIQGNMWMCGFPDNLLIATIGGEYVVVSFGAADLVNVFKTHLTGAYADAEVLYDEAVIA